MPKKVLIIHTDGNSFNNPTLKCIIDLLLEKGYGIDLRYPKSDAPMPSRYEGIRFLCFGELMRRWKMRAFNKYSSRLLMFLLVLLERLLYYRKYDLIIGVDRQGFIEASILNRITNTPYVFISFEIMFEEETSARYKSLEKRASKGVAAWIVQDDVRAEQLQRENQLDPSNKILLPLASAGIGLEKNERLRDQLGIPRNKKVAILMGSLDSWSMAIQIIKCVTDWPEEWVLIVHARYGRTREFLAGEIAAFSDLLNSKIYISDMAAEMVDDMGGILAGVSAGLAFYKPEFLTSVYGNYIGKNLHYLGLASGKISTCLRYSVPVIMNEIGLYAEEARKFRFGCVVERPEQIKNCLNEIIREEYRYNAKEYFATKLDFNLYKRMIWSRLEAIVDNA